MLIGASAPLLERFQPRVEDFFDAVRPERQIAEVIDRD